ncbi:MAG: bifunctional precorrin-2 dehydrogenase/sirohydrochlorin ferrochelatase [Candidatus Omnitrophica bacterium]|nr:bifunctional precorrin-2 dehydrogenase/sirohydrochlorin ferrochelatase [Candidatus Omnitrophota bacterium]
MKFSKQRCYYPIGLDVAGKECVVIGGGRVAERKVTRLLEYGAQVTVVSPVLTPLLKKWVRQDLVLYRKKKFSNDILQKQHLVFALTNDLSVNRRIACEARKKNIPVNVAKPGKASTFILPAVLRRPSFSIAISTGGRCPKSARKIREKLEKIL